jgi:hypothetical protein
LRRRHYQDLYRDIANAAGVPRTVWNMFARHGGVTEARPQHHQPALHRAVGGDLPTGCQGAGRAPAEAERKMKNEISDRISDGFRTAVAMAG